ncbi:small ribosomal subunit protein bS21 [Tundrisphaera lichenicola]|uniref:small ribosomal subunit protein bS21 n=1 Tax=Tundrisphaera lichenicola TaxID=2029860 RepID=UPI003EBB224E
MGIRIELEEDESIEDALRRFRKLIRAEGAYPLNHCRWHKARRDIYLKPSILNRRRRWNDRVRKRGCGLYTQGWEYHWADDIEMRPRRSWGPMGRHVTT